MVVFSRCGPTPLLLCFMISGAAALIKLLQPPVIAAPLGHDVLLPCELQASQDVKITNTPVLYWTAAGDRTLEVDRNSSNYSHVLKKVQWSDSGSYQCKMSIKTSEGSFRLKGTNTTLVIYDTMTFNPSSHNHFLLRCEINVSEDLGFALSVLKDGSFLQGVDSDHGPAISGAVTLSQTVSLTGGQKYECLLLLRGDLVTSSTFYTKPTAPGGGGESQLKVYPLL
ncbi:uncharacterized protein LOC119798275 [Cyprinodon tularosa]|uniref:uncharacterized protein LOC119798275 n=1 Tax=Cyprinodon tularosa TaxID=77115 RepID=UPI0018E27B83|nr:uncharacterized protein LOC119798275 [Cyprinodon tularosa]